MPEEYADDSALTVQQEMRRSLTEIFVKLSVEISSCFSYIKAVSYTHLHLLVIEKVNVYEVNV